MAKSKNSNRFYGKGRRKSSIARVYLVPGTGNVKINNKEIEEKAPAKMSKQEKMNLIDQIEKEMKEAASNLQFERATELRDILFELKEENGKM